MPNWFAVYRDSDGALLSTGTVLGVLPTGVSSITVNQTEQPDHATWNTVTRAFDLPASTKPLVRTRNDFLDLFTDAELAAILSESKKDTVRGNKVSVQLERLAASDEVDLTDSRVVNGVSGLETLGLIAVGRAAVILNG